MLWENPKDAIITLMILLMVIGCVNVFPEIRIIFWSGI